MQGIVLLSGGLDSVVSMLLGQQEAQLVLALTIDYGQRACHQEIKASQYFADQIQIPHRVVQLPFMQELSSDLTMNSSAEITDPWVPNRNGLFINLAACFAENLGADMIICGFNSEEAINFPDNSADFIGASNQALHYSTLNHVQVKSYVQNMSKEEIIRCAQDLKIDFSRLWSCYQAGEKPCGTCPSCITNQNAFRKVGIYV